jgi:hypothetical protein
MAPTSEWPTAGLRAAFPPLAVGLFIGMALAAATGCGRRVTLVPVSGVVEVDGKPLAGGAITVAPADGRAAGGAIEADGRFTLSTFAPGDGVMPGRHKVVVNASKALSDRRVQWLVPRSLRSLATTSLELEVIGPTDAARVSISTAGEKPEIEVIDVRGDIPDLGGGPPRNGYPAEAP